MVDSYGELVRQAREAKNISAKQLSEKLNVSAPFITDIEKNRRLPSLQNQNKIKKLLASKQFPETLFDDLAAADNEDTRIAAEDIAKDIRKKPALRELIRVIHKQKLSWKCAPGLRLPEQRWSGHFQSILRSGKKCSQ